ncbi:MAG: chemotaxis protein CheX [Nitrospirota bacterium]|jgi:chemotaxis protein CheX
MIDIDSIYATLRDTTKHVLKTIAFVDALPGEIVPSDKNTLVGYVSGNVGLTGEMKISITVSFSKEAITRIYHNMFPDERAQVTVFHMGDLVGEITNMISGNLRNILAGLDMRFDAGIPTVVIGSQQIYHPSGTISKVIPFEMQGDTMFIEVGIKTF